MRTRILALAATAALLAACGGSAPTPSTATSATAAASGPLPTGPGWTGATRPEEVIRARFELMAHVEELMLPIDEITVGEPEDPQVLKQNAEVIGAMLSALPHLFPPTTNLFDPKAAELKTLALPAIWEDFDGFYAAAQDAVHAADAMAAAETKESRVAASLALRATCDACHAKHLRPYPGVKVLPSDYEFDFDSIFKP
jgi:cytochrome c556